MASALLLIVRRVGGGIPKKGWGRGEVVASSSSSSNCWVNKTDSDGSSLSEGKDWGSPPPPPFFSWEIECCSLFFQKVFFVHGALKVGSQTLGYLFPFGLFSGLRPPFSSF